MLDYPALRAVATVVQTGSFERAAKALNVTPSAVSQRVKLLEERLGVVVIERGVPCTATERGEWLCRHMEHVGMLETELMANLPGLVGPSEPTPRVTLNIATNSDSLATWFLPAVAAFTRASDYLLKVAVDDEDHTVEWLQRGRVLAAVTSIAKPVQGCRAIRSGRAALPCHRKPGLCPTPFLHRRHARSPSARAGDHLQPEGSPSARVDPADARREHRLSDPLAPIDAEFHRREPPWHRLGAESGEDGAGPS